MKEKLGPIGEKEGTVFREHTHTHTLTLIQINSLSRCLLYSLDNSQLWFRLFHSVCVSQLHTLSFIHPPRPHTPLFLLAFISLSNILSFVCLSLFSHRFLYQCVCLCVSLSVFSPPTFLLSHTFFSFSSHHHHHHYSRLRFPFYPSPFNSSTSLSLLASPPLFLPQHTQYSTCVPFPITSHTYSLCPHPLYSYGCSSLSCWPAGLLLPCMLSSSFPSSLLCTR